MKTIRLTMAQALIRFLDNQYIVCDGVETKFVKGILGIFGHGNATGIGEAIENTKHQLTFIQGHNEQSMVHTAIAFAKQNKRRKIMACTSSIGPGALNMITGAATATTNRIPVLLLPGDIFACRQPDPVLQQLENATDYTCSVNDCFKPISKFWDRISRPEQLIASCLQAMRVLIDPVETGAVTLCLPQDVQAESYDYPLSFFEKRIHRMDRIPISEESLNIVKTLLQQSKSPLIIAGGGVNYSQAEAQLAEFSKQCSIPVAVTQAGKGIMIDEQPFYVGGIGVTGTQTANRLAKEADLIIALGTRLSDFTTASKTAFQHPKLKLVNININPLDGIKMEGVFIRADIKSALEKIMLHANDIQTTSDYQSFILDLKNNWQYESQRVIKSESNQLIENSQLTVINTLNNFVDDNAVIVCAAGSLPGDLHRFWRVKGQDTYHMEYAFSCMGYEIAGGLGVKIANPSKEVYVLVGDGSFLMMHSALIECLQENIKINIILFDNQGYQCIQRLQNAHGSQGFGCAFTQSIDFKQLASSMGVQSYFANDLDSFKKHLVDTKESTQTTLIAINVSATSMSHGYDTGWRVDVPAVSSSESVLEAHQRMQRFILQAKKY